LIGILRAILEFSDALSLPKTALLAFAYVLEVVNFPFLF